MDAMIEDRHFWAEAPIYALHYDVHGMLALAEAALHYDGTDLYHYVSKKSGASIKDIVDGYILMSYPLERTGIGRGSIRLATFADGSTSYTPRGELFDTFLVNPLDATPSFSGDLEIAYKRYHDPGYAWLLSLNPKRDANVVYGRATWGYIALTHGEPLPERPSPPPAPGGVYPGLGFALLRADQSPDYWTSGGLTAVVMLGKWLSHGHRDDYSLILHAKGRLLYPDLNVIQYEPSYLNWSRDGNAHSTLLVDHQSPSHGPFTTRQDFGEDVKYFSITGSAYQGVRQTRAVLLTKEYLADFFQAADVEKPARPHVYDWVLHGLGRLYPGNPGAYHPSDALVPYYWWIENERARTTTHTFQADWIQRSAGITPRIAAPWPRVVRSRGGCAYDDAGKLSDGRLPWRRPDHQRPSLPSPGRQPGRQPADPGCATGRIRATVRGGPRALRGPAEDPGGPPRTGPAPQRRGNRRPAADFTDYLMTAFDDDPHTLASCDGEVFTFSDYGYVRVDMSGMHVSGKIRAFQLPATLLPPSGQATIDGKKARWSLSEASCSGAPLECTTVRRSPQGTPRNRPLRSIADLSPKRRTWRQAAKRDPVAPPLRRPGPHRRGVPSCCARGLAGRAGPAGCRTDGRRAGADGPLPGSSREERGEPFAGNPSLFPTAICPPPNRPIASPPAW